MDSISQTATHLNCHGCLGFGMSPLGLATFNFVPNSINSLSTLIFSNRIEHRLTTLSKQNPDKLYKLSKTQSSSTRRSVNPVIFHRDDSSSWTRGTIVFDQVIRLFRQDDSYYPQTWFALFKQMVQLLNQRICESEIFPEKICPNIMKSRREAFWSCSNNIKNPKISFLVPSSTIHQPRRKGHILVNHVQ